MKRKSLLLLWLIAMMLAPRWGFAQDNIKHQPRQANEQMLVVGEPSGTPRATASVPFYETFEGTIDWTIVNGSATNKWYVGSPGAHYGNYGLFISNDSGTTNAYTVGSASVVYAYKDIYLEAGTYNLSFDIKQYGESTWDCVGAMLYNSSTTPSASTSSAGSGLTSFPSGYTTMITGVGYSFSNGSWKNSSTNFTVSEAGTYKLTFCWKNDTSGGTQPPASIDNVSVEKCYNALYTVSASADPSNGGALVHSETYNFDDHSMQGWTSLDADGDGFGWDFGAAPLLYEPTYTFEGYNSSADCMISGSYDNHGYVLYPDNYLVSPQVQLGGSISFYARNRSNDYPEHLGVAVSTSGNTSASSFTTIQHWDVTSESWTLYTVDLSTYAGQTGYVAIRNYNYSDHFQVFVDEITITSGSVSSYSQSLANGVSSTVTATPSSGYSFFGWTENDNLISANTSYTFTATGNRALTANFGVAYLISDSGDITTCSGAICDPGGPTGNYGNSNSYTRTIYPGTQGMMVQLIFTQFATEGASWDWLDIFDGTSSSAPSLGRWGGSNSPGTVRATNPDGALTLYWRSDGSNVEAGFTALISCVEPTPVLNVTSVGITTASLEWTGASSGYTLQYGTTSMSADFETGDMSQASFTYSGGNWTTSTTSPYNGTYCAKSGNAGTASSTSYMEVSVTLSNPGVVSFAAKISSESGWDKGYFYINDVVQSDLNGISGAGSWQTYSYNLAAGTYTFKWAYSKDGSTNSNDDCFYVDDIKIYNIASSVSTSNTNYNLSSLTAETDYVALVKGTDSPWSDPVFFTTESASDAYPISGSGDVTTCSGIFTDSNPSGNYGNSESYTRTFYPGTQGNVVQMTFLSFDTEGADYLYVYDGTSTSATQIGVYSGHSVTCPFTVKATNSAGALTFRFTSDGSLVYPGWEAEIACVEPKPVLTVSNITTNSATASWTGASSSYTVRYGAVNPFADFETGDMSQASFTYSGGNWTTSTTSPYNGTYCAKSGNAGSSSSTSYMEVSVTLSSVGFVSFAGKVSSETCCDHGYFYIDGTQQVQVADDAAWHTYSYELTAGTHTLRWAYTKDSSVNSGDDCFYVDDIMVADLANTATTSSTSYNMTGLTMGTWYMATVQGANSDMSDPVVFQTPSTHTLTASVNPANSGTISDGNNNISGATTYNHGTSVTLTATPNTGYDFIGWTVDGSSVGITNPTTVTMDQDHSVVANFELQRFTISASANPSAGGTVNGAGNYNYNTSCTLSTTVNNGYTFTGWFENNSLVSTSTSYTFTVTAARTLEARFTQDTYSVSVSASPAAGGTVNGGGNTFTYGASCTVTAAANPGYTFTGWFEDNSRVSTSTSYTFTVLAAHTLEARFTQDEYTLNLVADPVGGGAVSASPAQATYHYNDVVTVTATPNSGYIFGSWSDGGTAQHTVTITGNTTLTAYFGADQTLTTYANPIEGGYVTITENQMSTIGAVEVGDASASGVQNVSSPYWTSSQYSFEECLYLASEISVAEGYITSISYYVRSSSSASSQTDDRIEVYMKNTSRTSFSSSNSDIEAVTANDKVFDGTWHLTNTTGWVTIVLDKPFHYTGSSLMIGINEMTQGASNINFKFTNTATLMGGGYSCRSRYSNDTPLDPTSLTSLPGQKINDRANVRLGFGTYHYGQSVTLTAHANEGYQFVNWTENSTEVGTHGNATYTVTMDADHTIYANFERLAKRFVTAGDWNVANNWSPTGAPDITEDVVIEAAATIPNGVVATANEITVTTGSITIQDGGQLQHNNAANSMVTVTAQNTIAGYTSADAYTNKGYELVSFPVDNLTVNSNAITGLVTSDPYDFYRFDASADPLEWRQMTSTDNISLLQGFIYASQEGTTISVTGPVMSSATPVNSASVAYVTANAPRFNGWALLGNPFVCNAYVSLGTGNGAGSETNFYKLNHTATYDEFVPFTNSDAVNPMGGVMFRVFNNDNIVYSRTASSGAKTGILNMDVTCVKDRATVTLDRARVRFGEGRNLEKLQFDTRHTKVYIPEDGNDFSVYYADGAGTIPVNFKAQDNGRYTLDFSTEDVGFNYLHLIDNMNGNDVDLLQTPYYAFDAKSTDFASRFTLVFATGNDNDDTFAFFNNGVWIINNDGDATLQVVDALGRMLSSENISGSTSKAINVAPGVYMLRLINGDKVKVQKIVVKR